MKLTMKDIISFSMIETFITTNYERDYLRSITERALILNDCDIKCVHKPMLERYFECDRLSRHEVYILSDDDVIPAHPDTLVRMVAILRKCPELSQLGLAWKPGLTRQEIGDWYRGEIASNILEVDHVGGIVAIRKSTIQDLGYKCDYPKGIGDDKIVAKIARERGYKVGLLIDDYFHHIGVGQTVVWNENRNENSNKINSS